jgi:ribosomal protein S18 acetylase RimI-like enzyme
MATTLEFYGYRDEPVKMCLAVSHGLHIMTNVKESYRRKGLGRRLVDDSLYSLRKERIPKCHLFVFGKNDLGKNFWKGTA